MRNVLIVISFLNFFYVGNLNIKDVWVRPANKGMNTALYFTVENNSNKADTLLSVTSSIAEIVQMHETFKSGEMMGMREVKAITINPNTTFEFKPGGHHIMVIGLKKTVRKNDMLEFTLHFKNAGNINVKASSKM